MPVAPNMANIYIYIERERESLFLYLIITVIRKFPITATRYITQNEPQSNSALTPGQESQWVLVQRAFRLSHCIWNMSIMTCLVDLRSDMVLSRRSSMVCHLLIPVKKWWIKEKKKFIYFSWTYLRLGLYFPCSSVFKESAYNVGDLSSIPGSGRSPGEGNGNSLQYSCLESPMDRGAWQAAVLGVTKSRTRLSDFTFTFHFHALEKEMATHSSVLAWRIPGMGEPGGLPPMGSHRVGHDWSDLAAAANPNYKHPQIFSLYEFSDIPSLSSSPPLIENSVSWDSLPRGKNSKYHIGYLYIEYQNASFLIFHKNPESIFQKIPSTMDHDDLLNGIWN